MIIRRLTRFSNQCACSWNQRWNKQTQDPFVANSLWRSLNFDSIPSNTWRCSLVPSIDCGSSRPASTIKTFVVLLHGKRMEGCPQSFELTRFGLRLGPFNHMTLLSVVPSFDGRSRLGPASTIKTSYIVLLHGKRNSHLLTKGHSKGTRAWYQECRWQCIILHSGVTLKSASREHPQIVNNKSSIKPILSFFFTCRNFKLGVGGVQNRLEGCRQSSEMTRFGFRLDPCKNRDVALWYRQS